MEQASGRTPGHTEDIVGEMMRRALRIAGTTLFSTEISGDYDAIGQAVRTAFAFLRRRMNALPFTPGWLPTRARRQFVRAKRSLDELVLRIIEGRRRAAPQVSEPLPDSPSLRGEIRPNDRAREAHDLLTLLLAAQDEETGVGMSDQQLKD